jgi:hypothetical protein
MPRTRDQPGFKRCVGCLAFPLVDHDARHWRELFTGNTALIPAAVMEGKATKKDMMKNWVTSYLGNFWIHRRTCLRSGTLGAAPGVSRGQVLHAF